MRTNQKPSPIRTHEGAVAPRINPYQELRRSVLACMLFEGTFYESGEEISKRIASLIILVDPKKVAALAIEAREEMKLRHVPLFIIREMSRIESHKHLVADTLERVIQRADELAEFLTLYWREGRRPISAQVKKGLARAFTKFSAYDLQKYNRPDAIKLRDVLFLTHAKPKNSEQAETWKQLIEDRLPTPDTWETALSAGGDKKAIWSRLIGENRLGALAFLRNLRNMQQTGVELSLIRQGLKGLKTDRVLPFRFISAARYAPQLEPELESLMFDCLKGQEKLPGRTVLLVDGSGSMFGEKISARSELDRFDAAAALAILAREMCEDASVAIFSYDAAWVPARRGFALRDALNHMAERGGTDTQNGIDLASSEDYDRIIIFTDEQSHQRISRPRQGSKGYVVNVSCHQNGIGYGAWNYIDGFSEAILGWIQQFEKSE